MSETPSPTENRLDRRKARTRAALIRAAQTLIAQGRTNAPILEITQAADVGMGSFYNHFETKEQLFDAAFESVLDAYGQLLDQVTADIEDPAEVFASSFRLTGRLHRREPELSRVLLNNLAPPAQRRRRPGPPRATGHHGRRRRRPIRRGRCRHRGHDRCRCAHRPRPAAPRPAGPRRRADHRPNDRGPAAHVRRTAPPGAPHLHQTPTRPGPARGDGSAA